MRKTEVLEQMILIHHHFQQIFHYFNSFVVFLTNLHDTTQIIMYHGTGSCFIQYQFP